MVKLRDIKMKPKLMFLFVVVGVVPLALISWWGSRLSTQALMQKSYGQLEAVREIKKSILGFEIREFIAAIRAIAEAGAGKKGGAEVFCLTPGSKKIMFSEDFGVKKGLWGFDQETLETVVR